MFHSLIVGIVLFFDFNIYAILFNAFIYINMYLIHESTYIQYDSFLML